MFYIRPLFPICFQIIKKRREIENKKERLEGDMISKGEKEDQNKHESLGLSNQL